jgi:hypothetical protein
LEREHLAISLTEGGGNSVILYDKPFQAPSFDVVLEWDVEILGFPPTTHLQTRTPHELVFSPGHPRPTVIQVFPQAEMWQNTKVGFTQMNKNGNLQNRIGIQMVRFK